MYIKYVIKNVYIIKINFKKLNFNIYKLESRLYIHL